MFSSLTDLRDHELFRRNQAMVDNLIQKQINQVNSFQMIKPLISAKPPIVPSLGQSFNSKPSNHFDPNRISSLFDSLPIGNKMNDFMPSNITKKGNFDNLTADSVMASENDTSNLTYNGDLVNMSNDLRVYENKRPFENATIIDSINAMNSGANERIVRTSKSMEKRVEHLKSINRSLDNKLLMQQNNLTKLLINRQAQLTRLLAQQSNTAIRQSQPYQSSQLPLMQFNRDNELLMKLIQKCHQTRSHNLKQQEEIKKNPAKNELENNVLIDEKVRSSSSKVHKSKEQKSSKMAKKSSKMAKKSNKIELDEVKIKIKMLKKETDKSIWEYYSITLNRVAEYGFGIAVSGGRDNPHFYNGDTSIAISDVLKSGPADGKLLLNDRVISANGISLENVDYSTAVQVLRECGNSVLLYIKRRVQVPNEDMMKISLTKNKKKEDFGIQFACKVYIKELSLRNLVEKEVNLKEGDLVLRINNTNIENLSLKEIRKLMDNSKEKLHLVIKRCSNSLKDELLNDFDLSNKENNLNLINGKNGLNGNFNDSLTTRNWLNQNVYVQPPTRNDNNNENKQQNNSLTNDCMTNRTSNNENPFLSDLNSDKQPQQSSARNRLPISKLSLNEKSELNNEPIPSFLRKDTQNDNLELDGPLIPSHLKNQQQPPSFTSGNLNTNTNDDLNNENSSPSQIQSHSSGLISNSNYNSLDNRYEISTNSRKNLLGKSESRSVSFQKEGNVGIRLIGGNQVGIFVTAIQPGSPAAVQGLKPGDKILKVNNIKMKSVTREEAVLYLLSVHNQIDLLVQYCKNEYEEILLNQKGDSFYIKANFNHQVASDSNELTIEKGDIFHVTDTLFNGVVGHWYVSKLNENREEIVRGTIPNESKANAIFESKNDQNGTLNPSGNNSFATAKNNDQNKSSSSFNSSLFVSSMKAASFFRRRRSARRTKSLGKEHWEEVIFADRTYQKLTAYQKIEYKHPGFIRPIVVLGALADFARQKLLTDYSDKYELPEFVVKSSSNKDNKICHRDNLSCAETSIKIACSSDTSHLDSLDDLERLKMMKKQREVEEDDEELQMASNQLNSIDLSDQSYQHRQRSFGNEDELHSDLIKQRHQNDELKNLDRNFDLNCFTSSVSKNNSLNVSSGFSRSDFSSNGGEISFGNNPIANCSNKNVPNSSGGIIKLSSIKTIIDKGKHALLDITPQAVNRLNYAQLYPIVIYLKADSKSIIKDLRIRHNKANVMNLNSNNSNAINTNTLNQNQKSSRKIFEECSKLEKNWSNLFTATINLTTADVWYKKLRETIEKQQLSNIWVTNSTSDARIADDFLVLPMQNNRLSYASSPDSDLDLSLGSNLNNQHSNGLAPCSTAAASFASNHLNQQSTSGLPGRLTKACSVPSIATIDELSINQSPFTVNTMKFKDNVAAVDPVFSHHMAPTDSSTPTTSFQMSKTPTKHDHQKFKEEEKVFYIKESSSAKISQNNFGNLSDSPFTNGYAIGNNTPTVVASNSESNSESTPNQLTCQMHSNRNSICNNNMLANRTLLNNADNNQMNNQSNTQIDNQVNSSHLNGNNSDMTLEPPRIDRGMKPTRFKGNMHERTYNGTSNLGPSDQITHPLTVLNGNNTNHTNAYNQASATSSSSSSSTPKPNNHNNNNPFMNGLTSVAPMQDYLSSNSPNNKQSKRKSSTMFSENNNSATNDSSPYSSNYVSPTNTIDNRPSGPSMNGMISNNFNNINNQLNQNEYQPTLTMTNGNQKYPSQMSSLMNGNPSLNYYSENGFNNGYLPRNHNTSNKLSNGSLPNQIDHHNPTQSQKHKPPTPPPKPSHYQRKIDLPGYYPAINNAANLPPPLPVHEPTYLQPQQQNYLPQQVRRRMPYADPNMDSIYMTTTTNGLINYQAQEIRNSYVQPVMPNSMQANLAARTRAMQQGPYPSQSPYLNVPYPPRQPQIQNHNLMMNGNNVNLPNHDQRSSAFELYRKPTVNNHYQPQKPILNGHQMMPNISNTSYYGLPPLPSPPLHLSNNLNESTYRHSSLSVDSQSQNVLSTVTGAVDIEGGVLKCEMTGVCMVIPHGALTKRQEIYFKVCQDSRMLPLDSTKGETLLSPICMCGPHGLKFNKPVQLILPHRDADREHWSFPSKTHRTNAKRNPVKNSFNLKKYSLEGHMHGSHKKILKNSSCCEKTNLFEHSNHLADSIVVRLIEYQNDSRYS